MLPEDEDEEKNKNPFGSGNIEMGIMNNYQGGEQIYGQNSQNGFWVW